MTTPAEFLPRVLATVADLALCLSHTPRDRPGGVPRRVRGATFACNGERLSRRTCRPRTLMGWSRTSSRAF